MNEDLFHLGIKALRQNDDGWLLLLKVNPEEFSGPNKHNINYWDLAGGRVHRGVTAVETLRREVEEEIGVNGITVVRPIGMVLSNIRIPLSDGSDVGLVLSVYECKLPPNAAIRLSAEHTAYEWFPPKDAAERLSIKYPKEFCEMIARLA